jgi:hypothetical protein
MKMLHDGRNVIKMTMLSPTLWALWFSNSNNLYIANVSSTNKATGLVWLWWLGLGGPCERTEHINYCPTGDKESQHHLG